MKKSFFIIISFITCILLSLACASTDTIQESTNISEEERARQIELENERIAKRQALLQTHYYYDHEWYQKDKFPASIENIGRLSIGDPCFQNNNPYGFRKNIAYLPDIQGSVLQWLQDGCLFDFAGVASSQLYWSCLAYLSLNNDEKNLLFDSNYIKFYRYIDALTYTTTNGGSNTVPVFEVIFFDKNGRIIDYE